MKLRSRTVMRSITKVFIAGLLSFCFVSAFSAIYYNPPIHIPCDDGLTDYKREENVSWFRAIEGFCFGRIDSNGYCNTVVPDHVDILCMGSSQTEGLYVNTDQTYCAVLNKLLESAEIDLNGYNIGMSAHEFTRNLRNLPIALEKYHPSYVVLETSSLSLSRESAEMIFSDNVEKLKSYSKSDLLYWIQKIPYVKLIYLQLKNYKNGSVNEIADEVSEPVPVSADQNNCFDIALSYLNELAEEYDFTPIILYLPPISLSPSGQNICKQNINSASFSDMCRQYSVLFIDMTDAFNQNYRDRYIVPTGFPNTAIGYGHLNKHGHRIIAEELYTTLFEDEGGMSK